MTYDWRDYERLAAKLVTKYDMRLRAAGAASARDDLMGEAMMAFVRATWMHDPDGGAKFSTYLHHAINNTLRRSTGYRLRDHKMHRSLDAPLGAETTDTLHDLTPDEREPAVDALERKEVRRRNLARLSPLSRKMVLALSAPGPRLTAERARVGAFYATAATRGYPARHVKLDLYFISQAIGLKRGDRRRALAEIKELARA